MSKTTPAIPTKAQAKAGNYRVGRLPWNGLDISIETPKGRSRMPGWPRMAIDYGYIRRTRGADGDHVDVFVGPKLDSPVVFVIDQVDRTGAFDEHKVMIGFTHQSTAVGAYRKCYTKDWKVGPVTTMTIEQFKNWLTDGSQRKPIQKQVSKYAASIVGEDKRWAESACGANTGKPGFGEGNTCASGGDASQTPSALAKAISQSQAQRISPEDHNRFARAIRQWEANVRQLEAERNARPKPEDHPHHLSKLDEATKKQLLDWHFDANEIFGGIGRRAHGAHMAGLDPQQAKQEAFKSIDPAETQRLIHAMQNMINQAAQNGVNLRPYVLHNKLVPRELAAKLKANDKLFHPVEDHERFEALHHAAVEHYAAKRRGPKDSPGQLDMFSGKQRRKPDSQMRWVTINGSHVLVDSKGVIRGGAGGKLTGKSVNDLGGAKNGKSKKDSSGMTAESRKKAKDYYAELAKKQEAERKKEPSEADGKGGYDLPKLPNDEAQEGDQLGLVDGEGKRKERKKFKPTEKGDAQQKTLIDGLDAGPGQTDMFGGDGTPDDMVLGGEKSPREQAAKAQKKLDDDYEFARASEIGNAGEDLKGSARHIRNRWTSLEDAEKDGSAEELVTRAKLLKNEPHNLAAHADQKPKVALALHLALNGLPPKPGYRGSSDPKKDRKDYVETYQNLKAEAEKLAESHGEDDYRGAIRGMYAKVGEEIKRLRGQSGDSMISQASATDRYNNTANALVSLHRKLGRSYGSTSIWKQVRTAELDLGENRSRLADAAIAVMEGKSLKAATGQSTKQADRFKPADMYVGIAERKGGPSLEHKDAKAAVSYLVDKVGMRGVQWGNSVSDEERKHHATMAAGAMLDLADVTGLPLDSLSMGGNLGFAIGARGKGRALAHYEPGNKVINLTRKKGVGSLAHEWAHALDHYMADHKSTARGAKFQSSTASDSRVGEAMKAVRKQWIDSGYRRRLSSAMRENGIGGKATDYWTSSEEMFARCFERHVQRKLETSGRKNSYLSGIETKAYKNGGLWPTNDEVAKMAPSFDALLDAYREETLGVKDRARYSVAERSRIVEQFHAAIVDQYKAGSCDSGTVAGQKGDCGNYVTIDGHPVFIESGKVSRGPKSMRGKHAKSVKGKRSRRAKIPRTDRSGDRDSPGQTTAFADRINKGFARKPGQQATLGLREKPKVFQARTTLDEIAVNAVGSDPDDVAHFRNLMSDAHKMLATEARESNDDLLQLMSSFGYGRSRIGAVQTLKKWSKAQEPDDIPRFDEMAESASMNYPHLLETGSGSSDKSHDVEDALFNRVKRGFVPVPALTDPAVSQLASDMHGRDSSDEDFEFDASFDPGDEWVDKNDPDYVPFAASMVEQVIERYHAIAS